MITREPRIFLSHSWEDKSAARRLARRLRHRGLNVWLDEDEMQLGDQLSIRLQSEIEACSHLLALWSVKAAKSLWVQREIEFARSVALPPIIVPAIIEEGADMEPLMENLGLSLVDPCIFETQVERLARAILGDEVPTARDEELLRCDLRSIADEAPGLRELIEQLSKHRKITYTQLAATHISDDNRHEAETALIALHELFDDDKKARNVISLVAGELFVREGVGYAVLERQMHRESPGSDNLFSMFMRLGDTVSYSSIIDPVIELFQRISPSQDQNLWSFAKNNFGQLTEEQKERIVALTSTPDRGPGSFTADLAFELFKRMPDNKALQQLWYWWIHDYKFGGKDDVEDSGDTGLFFALMNEAHSSGLSQFEPIIENFEDSFRMQAKTGKLQDINSCIKVLITASRRKYHRLDGLVRAMASRMGSAEWNEISERHSFMLALDQFLLALKNDKPLSDALRMLTEAQVDGAH